MLWVVIIMVIAIFGGRMLKSLVDAAGEGAGSLFDAATEHLAQAPADPVASEKVERIAALKARGDAEAMTELVALTNDANHTVRSLARSAIEVLRDRR